MGHVLHLAPFKIGRYRAGTTPRPKGMRHSEKRLHGKSLWILVAVLAGIRPADSQIQAAPATPPPATLASRPEPQHWALVPILMSTAETGLQIGGLVIRFLNPQDTANKSSTLGFAARVSQKSQVQINLFPEWYWSANRYHATAELNAIRWPAEFYGLGNGGDIPKEEADPYLAQGLGGKAMIEREIQPGLSAGPHLEFNYEAVENRGPARRLHAGVSGEKGGLIAGTGAVLTYDGRDAVYWARRGAYARAQNLWHAKAIGSDFDYNGYCLELRRFFPLFQTAALGIAATVKMQTGDVPFRELSTPDGDHQLRGLVRGKYRDRDLLLVQAEYKSYFADGDWLSAGWIRHRLGWVVFAEAGQVAHDLAEFAADRFHPAFGLGLRYAMNPAQRMNIRVDLGFVDGTIAPAINIKEAF